MDDESVGELGRKNRPGSRAAACAKAGRKTAGRLASAGGPTRALLIGLLAIGLAGIASLPPTPKVRTGPNGTAFYKPPAQAAGQASWEPDLGSPAGTASRPLAPGRAATS